MLNNLYEYLYITETKLINLATKGKLLTRKEFGR